MAASLTKGPIDAPATAEQQLAAYVEASKLELAGVEARLAGVDEKGDPKLHAKLTARVKHIKEVIKKAGSKLPKEQAVVETADTEQATA